MLFRAAFAFRSPTRWLALPLCLLLSGAASAQQWPSGGADEMERDYRKYKDVMAKLQRGEVQPGDNQEAVDFAAKWAVYRCTWIKNEREPGAIDRIHSDLDKDLADVEKHKANSQAYLQAFAKQVAVRGKEVLADSKVKPIGGINVARVLTRVARATGQEDLADPLTEAIVNPNSNDGVRYWSMRGLGELFAALAKRTPPTPMSAAREQKAIQALVDFIQRKVTFAADAPTDEKEGYRLLRREAVAALAQTRVTASADGKMRPALVLLQVMGRDASIRPEPRLDERVEAAVGLARMPRDDAKGYQPDFAAYQIGLFLGGDFAEAYLGKGAKDLSPWEKNRPWKIYAARLSEALQGMKTTTKDAYAAKVVDTAARFLAQMEATDSADPRDLSGWLTTSVPGEKTLFKGVADAVVKPADKEEAAPEKPAEEKKKEEKDKDAKKDGKEKKDGKDK